MKEEKEDFFEEIPEDRPIRPKEPKKPTLHPDDPLYYEQEEGRWEHLSPSPYRRVRLMWSAALLLIIIGGFCFLYIYFFTPQVDDAVQYGYVENVQKEGMVFNTYEVCVLPYKSLMDTVRPYEGDFNFSTNDELAARLRYLQASGKPVRLEYKVYRTRLPWRGNSNIIVTAVDSLEPSAVKNILPPDRRPEYPR